MASISFSSISRILDFQYLVGARQKSSKTFLLSRVRDDPSACDSSGLRKKLVKRCLSSAGAAGWACGTSGARESGQKRKEKQTRKVQHMKANASSQGT
jgi:hypothetical protein